MSRKKSGTVYIEDKTGTSKEVSGSSFTQKELDKLDELEKRSKTIIFETQSQRPLFTKNRDRLTICLNRVTITRGGRYTGEEFPMQIENITTARVYKHFMFSSLDIDTFGVIKPGQIDNLRTNEARLARRYILALIECKKSDIDLSFVDLFELREKLKSIGMVHHGLEEESYEDL